MIINVVNRKAVTNIELARVIAGVNAQIALDFAPYWGMPCIVRAGLPVQTTKPAFQDSCVLYIQKDTDISGALGYHDRTAPGVPYGFIFTEISEELGEPWSVTFSHEVLEMIADPQVNVLAMGPHPAAKRQVFHWYEMCDAVQAQTYKRKGVVVSNFVLPFYFTTEPSPGPRDFLKTGLKSFGVAPGGYVGFYDPAVSEHVTYPRDRLAKKRLAVKEKLGAARRSNRYKQATSAGGASRRPRRPSR